MKKRIKKGFTLVELLVVIAILAILASVTVVGYSAFTQKAKDSVAQQELTQIHNYLYAEDINNDDITFTADGLVIDKEVVTSGVDTYIETLISKDFALEDGASLTATASTNAAGDYVVTALAYETKDGGTHSVALK